MRSLLLCQEYISDQNVPAACGRRPSSNTMESTVTKTLCATNGSILVEELESVFFGRSERVNDIIANREKFIIGLHNGEVMVVAKTRLALCKAKDCRGCGNLHLCKGFLFGSCQADQGKGTCRFSHDLTSAHNAELLRKHDVAGLDRRELLILLLQNDAALLPPVCHDYNNGVGEHGQCQDADRCTRLHICEKYLRGHCSCSRAHDFYEPHPHKTLERRGVPNQLFCSIKAIYTNKEILKCWDRKPKEDKLDRWQQQQQRQIASTDISSVTHDPTDTADDSAEASKKNNQRSRNDGKRNKTDICTHFIKGHCKHGDKCFNGHYNLPYRWEVKEERHWRALPDNEKIEEDFCNPNNTYSRGILPVCFDTMTCGLNKARRLSTISSGLQPTLIHTTVWLWYWESGLGNWTQYATMTGDHQLVSITSTELEQMFQADGQAVIKFSVGPQSYTLNFQDMIQTNNQYGTKRMVRRRPKFVSSAEVSTVKTRRPVGYKSHFKDQTAHQYKLQIPETGCKQVQLQSSSQEDKIESLLSTPRLADIRWRRPRAKSSGKSSRDQSPR